MSVDIPNMSSSESFNEGDPFKDLSLFDPDPKFAELLHSIKDAQAICPVSDIDTVYNTLERFNGTLEARGWTGDNAQITGKIRLNEGLQADEIEKIMAESFFQDESLVKQYDEKGEYWYLTSHCLLTALVDVDNDDPVEARYVLSFRTPTAINNAEGGYREVQDVLNSTGEFIMYPEDIVDIQLSTPSLEQIERVIRQECPDMYRQINECIDLDVGKDGRRMHAALQNITIPLGRMVSERARDYIGKYIYHRLGTDDETDYEFQLHDEIHGLNDRDELVTSEESAHTTLRGRIVATDVGHEEHDLHYIVAEPSPQGEGWEICVVPVESVKKVRATRSRRARFGAIAMRTFSSPEDAAMHWQDRWSDTYIDDEVEKFVEELNMEFPADE